MTSPIPQLLNPFSTLMILAEFGGRARLWLHERLNRNVDQLPHFTCDGAGRCCHHGGLVRLDNLEYLIPGILRLARKSGDRAVSKVLCKMNIVQFINHCSV